MDRIIDYISSNKEWLFSGIGIVLILIIFRPIKSWIVRVISKKQTGSSGEHEERQNIAVNADKDVNFLQKNINNPSEIINSIKNRPPYQQKDATKYYIGLRVHWNGKLSSAYPENKGKISIFLISDEWQNVFVNFEVRESDYPEIKTMHKNTAIELEGTILEVGFDNIKLENVKIL